MAYIRYISPAEASPRLKELYGRYIDPMSGQVANIVRVSGQNPAFMEAHYGLYSRLMRGPSPLTRRQREMMAVVVSRTNDCHY